MNFERLALGTAQFGGSYGVANRSGQVSQDNIDKILKICEKNEISCIDTAVAYGKSEETLGNFDVTKYKIVSKLTEITEISSNIENFIVNQVKETLSKLNISKLHGLLLHRPEQLLLENGTQIYGALKNYRNWDM